MEPAYLFSEIPTRIAGFLYNWQTLIAGIFALVAAFSTVRATTKAANREIKTTQDQMQQTIDYQQSRQYKEDISFLTVMAAAMGTVIREAESANEILGKAGSPVDARGAYLVRKQFTKTGFNELRVALVTRGNELTPSFVKLEADINYYMSQCELKGSGISHSPVGFWVGNPNGLVEGLHSMRDQADDILQQCEAQLIRAREAYSRLAR